MSKPHRLEWIIRRVPSMPKFRTARQLMKLSKRDLAERCWAADLNYEGAEEMASEAWARCAELVEMLEGKRPLDADLLVKLNEHRAHVVACKMGSCEHEYAALVRAGCEPPAPEGGRV